MSRYAKTATIVQELVEFDGPQLLLLESSRHRHMLALAVKRSSMDAPFFACEVQDRTYDRYFSSTADLHYAFQNAVGNTYYFFDLDCEDNGAVPLETASQEEAGNKSYWPAVGFFARSHTNPHNVPTSPSTVKRFKIDGKWAADDFSHFHGKMSDLYALFGVLNRLGGTLSVTEKGFIHNTVHERFWQGGGSYIGFYDSLSQRNSHLNLSQLEVAKIAYASPGEISLRGDQAALSDIIDILSLFADKSGMLAGQYRNIYGALRKERLLSADPSTPFSSKALQDVVEKNTRRFAESMNISGIEDIYDACNRNVLVFSKLILSIYRRANELYRFRAEGRVQTVD